MTRAEPADLTVFYDYHCPYSHRAVAWLEDLPTETVRIVYRAFPLEQVNRDPSAETWRIWEQPLEYEHYRGRQDRRPLAPFLATHLLEEEALPSVVRRFRLGVYRARFDESADITDPVVLGAVASAAGADGSVLAGALTRDEGPALAGARARLRDDWSAARVDWAVFGVPTLALPDRAPVYLRLARRLGADEGRAFWSEFAGLTERAPFLLELKVPEPLG